MREDGTQQDNKGKGTENVPTEGGVNIKKIVIWTFIILCFLSIGGCLTWYFSSDTPTMSIENYEIIDSSSDEIYELDWEKSIPFEAINFGDNAEWSISYVQNGNKEVLDTTLQALDFTYMLYAGAYLVNLKDDKNSILAQIKINVTDQYKDFLKDDINRLVQLYKNNPASDEGIKAKELLKRIFGSGKVITLEQQDGTVNLTIEDFLKKAIDDYTILTPPDLDNDGKVTAIVIAKGEISDDKVFALFSFPSTCYFGEVIQFNNKSINAASFEWDFGDGGQSTEENPTHTYSSVGRKKVTLTVIGKNGKSDSMSKEIEISKKEEMVVKPKKQVPPEPVQVKETPPIIPPEPPSECPPCPAIPIIAYYDINKAIKTDDNWTVSPSEIDSPGKKKITFTYKQINSKCNCEANSKEILFTVSESIFQKRLNDYYNNPNTGTLNKVLELVTNDIKLRVKGDNTIIVNNKNELIEMLNSKYLKTVFSQGITIDENSFQVDKTLTGQVQKIKVK